MRKLLLGQKAQTMRIFRAEDIAEYRTLSGDIGLEFSDELSDDINKIVPGPLIGGMFSYLLGTNLPGRGTNWLKQRLNFIKAAYIGEKLDASVKIVRLRPEKKLVNLRTVCTNAEGKVICEGEALVMVTDVETNIYGVSTNA